MRVGLPFRNEGQLNQILIQLQPGYATLFGKPELS